MHGTELPSLLLEPPAPVTKSSNRFNIFFFLLPIDWVARFAIILLCTVQATCTTLQRLALATITVANLMKLYRTSVTKYNFNARPACLILGLRLSNSAC